MNFEFRFILLPPRGSAPPCINTDVQVDGGSINLNQIKSNQLDLQKRADRRHAAEAEAMEVERQERRRAFEKEREDYLNFTDEGLGLGGGGGGGEGEDEYGGMLGAVSAGMRAAKKRKRRLKQNAEGNGKGKAKGKGKGEEKEDDLEPSSLAGSGYGTGLLVPMSGDMNVGLTGEVRPSVHDSCCPALRRRRQQHPPHCGHTSSTHYH